MPSEVDPELLPRRERQGQYGKYFEYRIEEDANSKANTILKMAKKRAQVDAVLTVANLSELFTQDFDDLVDADDMDTPQKKVDAIKEQIKQKEKVAEYVCADCGKTIQKTAFEYSQNKFKKPLCYNCQNKYKAKQKCE